MKARSFPVAVVGCLVLAGESLATAQEPGDAATRPATPAPALAITHAAQM